MTIPDDVRSTPRAGRYREDLAYIHDAGYGGVARDAASRLVEELGRTGYRDGTVVDLGCGSGILAQHVLEAGYAVFGVDASDAMVALARKRAPSAEFRVASFASVPLPPCVAVTATGEVVNYALDAVREGHALTDLCRRVFSALMPRGVWLFDVAGPERAESAGGTKTFTEGPDWAVLVETGFDAVTGVLTRHITSFRQVGALYRRHSEVHRLRLTDHGAVLASLRGVGFDVDVLPSYGGSGLPPGVVAFLARKPGDAP